MINETYVDPDKYNELSEDEIAIEIVVDNIGVIKYTKAEVSKLAKTLNKSEAEIITMFKYRDTDKSYEYFKD